MLVALRIRNFVLIDSLELALAPGFNALTGETGAGKSIVVDALGLVLGQRARGDVVRPGAEEAEVEALFDISAGGPVAKRLAEGGIDADGELVIRRVLHKTGRSRAYLNGRMVSAKDLAAIARDLSDVTTQHESVALVDPRAHLDYLDRYCGVLGGSTRTEMAEAVRAVHETEAAIRSFRERDRDRAEREAFLRYQLEAIDAVGPRDGEHEELVQELSRLKHGEKLRAAAARVVGFLEGDDGGVCDELGRMAGELRAAAEIDERLRGPADETSLCWSKLTDLGRELGHYAERIETDPARLEQIQERLFDLEKLARQHGPTLAGVIATRARIAAELDEIAERDARLPELEEKHRQRLEIAGAIALKLSRKRREAAKKLAKAIAGELADLGMREAAITVEVAKRAAREGEPAIDGAHLGTNGIDRVEILIAPNRGSEPKPLGQIASGGELSRLLLALRRALAATGQVDRSAGIVVLDEIDAGVGGETADRIGRAIASIADARQVLCITHLANIAAYADAQFVVQKHVGARTTTSTAALVEGEARVAELARMLTGTRTGSTERAAKDLLAAARKTRGLVRAA